jgi:protein disulfide-isomerase
MNQLPRSSLLVIALGVVATLLGAPAVAADAKGKSGTAPEKTDAPKPAIESFKLASGETVVGIYDAEHGQLSLVDKRTGRVTGSRGLKAESIVERKPFAVDPTAGFSMAPKPAAGGNGEWIDSYEAALAAAQASKRPILIDFTGSDWCGWCIKLHKEVFDTPEFKQWASEKVVLLKADFPHRTPIAPEVKQQNQQLAAKFQIDGYPTIVVIDATGKELARSGYLDGGPKAWIDDLAGKSSALKR